MPQPCFSRLSERLLRGGIAPRHVRRTIRELSDHFDDLVREEKEAGAAREVAQARALSRLGHEDNLADAILSRPELRSLTSRFPWAVFGLGPVLLLAFSVVAALYLEVWLLNHSGGLFTYLTGQPPGPVSAKLATQVYTAYNTFVVYGAPLLFAWLFYWLGSRQRMPRAWIIAGVALICVLGGFQNLVFYDKGYVGGGVLLIESGLVSPFVHFSADSFFSPFPYAEGIARAAMNLAIAGGIWWWVTARKKVSTVAELHIART
ncbi:MAG: hypothetical protein J0H61_08210 [Alphaproteobacteria bacterium]|nr:hypothetical protein [Alphaproteobacteria bacterium]